MDLKIEDASIRILDDLYEIEKQCFDDEAFSKQQIGYLLADYNAVGFVARVNGEIAGFIIGRIELIRNQPVGHIMTVDVLPFHRRRGIGRRLMLEIEAIFKQKGAKECRLEAREGNVAALKLYGRLGYKNVAVLKNYYGQTHGVYLRKNPL
ncbi:MAG: GNAT family N-acetyltransferase [Candidatus Bathyarchaeota archaeon]|nr:GNAT family N-acetyltransferase [Candidatus Bathyarchaeota archaeon]